MLFFTFWIVAFAAFLSIDVLLRRDGLGNDAVSMACGAVFALIVTFCLFLASLFVSIYMPTTKFFLVSFVAALALQPLGAALMSPRPARR